MDELLMNTVVLDTETTSLDCKEAEIIEFGFVLKMEDDWQQFDELHKPSQPISPIISAVTYISNRMVEDKPPFEEAVDDFDKILETIGSPDDTLIVAHNVDYDKGVFEARYNTSKALDYDWVCTLRMARKLFKDDPTVEKYTLGYLRYRFDLDVADDLPMHRASADAYVAAKLFEYLLEVAEEQGVFDNLMDTRARLIEWLAEPIVTTIMPFGKHKGKKLTEVPADYWAWALDNMNSLNENHDDYDADFAASVINAFDGQL
jgi:DNA polymerase III epsilon subunit-like protein